MSAPSLPGSRPSFLSKLPRPFARHKPLAGDPIAVLVVQVLQGRALLPKDRNGLSDPFLAIRVGTTRYTSPTVYKSLNPVWGPHAPDAPAEGTVVGEARLERVVDCNFRERIEIVVWDRDRLRKEYMGEISIGVDDLFHGSDANERPPIEFNDPLNQAVWYPLLSSRSRSSVTGALLVRIGFLPPPALSAPLVRTPTPSSLHLSATQSSPTPASSKPASTVSKDLSSEQKEILYDVLLSLLETREGNRRASKEERVLFTVPTEGVGTMPISDVTPQGVDSTSKVLEYASESSEPESESEDEAGAELEDALTGLETAVADGAESSLTETESSTEEEGDTEDEQGYFDAKTLGEPEAPSQQLETPPLYMPLPPIVISPSVGREKDADAACLTATPPRPSPSLPPTSPSLPVTPSASSTRRRLALPRFMKRDSSRSRGDDSDLAAGISSDVAEGAVSPGGTLEGKGKEKAKRRRFSRKKALSASDVVDSEQDGAKSGTTGSAQGVSRRRRKSKSRAPTTVDPLVSQPDSGPSTPAKSRRTLKLPGTRRLARRKTKRDYNFTSSSTSCGLVQLEIRGATNLPRWSNTLRTSFDMDPFVIISFGKKVFRTRIIRHSLNPTWDEKLFFHVAKHEEKFLLTMKICDWDVAQSNESVGSVSLSLDDLFVEGDGVRLGEDGFYETNAEGKLVGDDFKERKLSIAVEGRGKIADGKEQPMLIIRAKFTPYDALRQQFWRTFLKQYDIDESGSFSNIEIYSMLDSLGSTLSKKTIDEFFSRFGKTSDQELTMDQVVLCLESELQKTPGEKRPVATPSDDSSLLTPSLPPSGPPSPLVSRTSSTFAVPSTSSRPGTPSPLVSSFGYFGLTGLEGDGDAKQELEKLIVEHDDVLLIQDGEGDGIDTGKESKNTSSCEKGVDTAQTSSGELEEKSIERVINIKECPLCRKPRMGSREEVDIITHIAICASTDPRAVNRIVVGSYVTASNAQRKWFTKIIGAVTKGSYALGANSANIIVQDRASGLLVEEKMAVYVRLGMRLAYKGFGAGGAMEGARIRRLLESMSIKQGIKFDSPQSAAEIKHFIAFHNLNLSEVLEPLSSFKTFNQFFYRKLRPDARPIADPFDPNTLVSPADSRAMFFETITEATQFWIKGTTFSLARLLGPSFSSVAHLYTGGSMAIFRLAPQDYHRYHSAVDGVVGPYVKIAGQYYTVNPQGVRSAIDIFGENVRVVQPILSEEFGETMNVWVGAMMVGSVHMSVQEGDHVKRGEELGYFAFGGSTIIILFQPGRVTFDEDLLANSRRSVETLVKMGMRVGRKTC